MLKEEGDSVHKGELIAELDDRDYVANLNKAKAETNKKGHRGKEKRSRKLQKRSRTSKLKV